MMLQLLLSDAGNQVGDSVWSSRVGRGIATKLHPHFIAFELYIELVQRA